MKIITKECKDKIVESYLAGNSAKESAGLFGHSWNTCFREMNLAKKIMEGRHVS